MIEILSNQKYNSVIPALLPKDIVVAHKTGSIDGVQHDSGLVLLPNKKSYAIVILSKNISNRETAIAKMAKISKVIYDLMVEDCN